MRPRAWYIHQGNLDFDGQVAEGIARYEALCREAQQDQATSEAQSAMTVAAVVVTYNRKDLLLRCLAAIEQQSHAVDAVFIWDNASNDGTQEALREAGWAERDHVQIIRSEENLGGAGGFHQGMKRAYDAGYDWLWLMDDDTIPRQDCWEHLQHGAERCKHLDEPMVLASKVLWKDGSIHPMNLIGTKFGFDRELFYDTAAAGCIFVAGGKFCFLRHSPQSHCQIWPAHRRLFYLVR